MELILELFIKGIIVDFLGLNTRYYFFKLIGNEKSKKELLGEDKKSDNTDLFSQHIFNVVVGLIVSIVIIFLWVYIVFG